MYSTAQHCTCCSPQYASRLIEKRNNENRAIKTVLAPYHTPHTPEYARPHTRATHQPIYQIYHIYQTVQCYTRPQTRPSKEQGPVTDASDEVPGRQSHVEI